MPNDFLKYSSTTTNRTKIPNHFIPPFNHFRPHRLSFLLEYVWFKKQCSPRDFDIVHSAYYNLSRACLNLISSGVPHIITVHDLIHELFETMDSQELKTRLKILTNANAIIAVSENTKKDLVNVYKSIDERKIHVIHHGFEKKGNANLSIDYKIINQKFLLYVGHREGYKNFNILLPTIKELNKNHKIQLVIVGPKFTRQEEELIKKSNVEMCIQMHGVVSDDYLSHLYSKCLAFLYPSIYEGFGYPLIEAMFHGAIPIATNSSCFPEVLGSAGMLVKSNCKNSIISSVTKLVMDDRLRRELKSKSYKRARFFSYDKQIKETISVYKSLIV